MSLLKWLDREDNAAARGFYLTAWNGDSGYTFDRIGRGLNLHIPALCLSLLGSTQPGRLAGYVRTALQGGAGDDGPAAALRSAGLAGYQRQLAGDRPTAS